MHEVTKCEWGERCVDVNVSCYNNFSEWETQMEINPIEFLIHTIVNIVMNGLLLKLTLLCSDTSMCN